MALTSFQIPSFSQILQSIINDYKASSTYYGYNISVDPGSELYLRFAAIAGQHAVMYNVMNVLVNSKLIDTATGADLDRVANDFGLQRKQATSAIGFVQLVSLVSQTILAGSLLTGPNALTFQVSQSGVYSNGNDVPVSSVDVGSQTNLPVGSIMTWSPPQVNMQSTCLVSVSITGGADPEDDNTLRNRLYLTLQAPPGSGNSQQLVTLSGGVDGVIQQAFVYNDFNGAGTQLIALTGYQTTSYPGRDIPHLPDDGYVKPYNVLQLSPGLLAQTLAQSGVANGYGAYNGVSLGIDNFGVTGTFAIGNEGPNLSNDTSIIYGQLPGPVANPYATIITTVNNYPADLAAVLTLPYPVGAATNGYGNGWMDTTPWPVPDGNYVNDGYCKVVSVQGVGTVVSGITGFGITIRAPSSGSVHTSPPFTSAQTYSANTPTNGATHIQWVNRSDSLDTGWVVVTAIVLAALDNGPSSPDTWSLVLDTPLVFPPDGYDFYNNGGVVVGDFIFPAAVNAQSYLNNVMQQYALLGPGQVTASQGLLILGASRYPSPNAQFPSTIGVQLERALVTNNQEVYNATVSSANFVAGVQPNIASAYNTAFNFTGQNCPPINAPPNIFIPNRIAFYPSETYNFGS